jgi:enoyl-CoA hydratase
MLEPNMPLSLSRDNGIATVALVRPDTFNVLNVAMLDALENVLLDLGRDQTLRCVIIRGSARAFSAGADLKELRALPSNDAFSYARRGQAILEMMEGLPVPSIAQINGIALGGGCELALAATFRVASATALIGLPELSLGLIPGFGGTQRLPRLVGMQAARRMILMSERISAEAALEIGLVDRVTSPESLSEVCVAMAEQIVCGSRSALAAATCCLKLDLALASEEGFRLEAEQFAKVFDTSERVEGLSAFFDKRVPHFDQIMK